MKCVFLIFGLLLAPALVVGQAAEQRWNILFILADDLGQTQLGCYGGPYTTPSLDRFASESMRFSNAYSAAAVCSPTRAAIMTGKYPARLHLTDFIKGDTLASQPLQQPEWQKFLPLEELTLAERFKDLGYRTAFFGKWHLSVEKRPPESEPYNPDKQGFDETMVTYKPGDDADQEADPHNVDAITKRAIEFLRASQEKPFLLFVSHNSIHDPLMESLSRVDGYENDLALKEFAIDPRLAAMVERMDEGLGRLLQALDELGLREQTLVVFASDNGGKHAYAAQHPYRAGKGWLYEGGIRVPLMVRLPGHITAGSQTELTVSSIDFLPTLLEAVGAEPGTKVDGLSFWKELTVGGGMPGRPLFWHYPHYHRGSGMRPASAMRKGRYKLIEWHEALLRGEEAKAYELYDLDMDRGETRNLVAELPGLFEAMRRELAEWKIAVEAQMPALK